MNDLPEEYQSLTTPASLVSATPRNGLYSIPALVPADFTGWQDTTAVPLPEGADRAHWRFRQETQTWQDIFVEVAQQEAEAAKQAQAQAEQEAARLQAENAEQAEQLLAAQKQTKEMKSQQGTLFDQLNGLSQFAMMNTEKMTDAQAIALANFLPPWSAQLGLLKVGQVVLDPDEGKPYRVLVEHKTSQDKIPGHDDADFKLIEAGTEATAK